jgi:hypothetical protein
VLYDDMCRRRRKMWESPAQSTTRASEGRRQDSFRREPRHCCPRITVLPYFVFRRSNSRMGKENRSEYLTNSLSCEWRKIEFIPSSSAATSATFFVLWSPWRRGQTPFIRRQTLHILMRLWTFSGPRFFLRRRVCRRAKPGV